MEFYRMTMKRLAMLAVLILVSVVILGCQPEVKVTYTVTFDANGGNLVDPQTVETGLLAVEPTDPTFEGYTFLYWYASDDTVAFDFTLPITADITLTAKWEYITTAEDLINADIAYVEANLRTSLYELYLPTKGKINKSTIAWTTTSKYIATTGYVLPVQYGDTTTSGEVTGKFTLNGVSVYHTFTVDLDNAQPVEITNSRFVPFTNKTTEYDVADKNVELFFEEGGYVPYISVDGFLSVLQGFVDPAVDFTISNPTSTTEEIAYQYYDETEDVTYDLLLTINSDDNTITTNDPAFYWAYIYSTATNYGRHIEYDYNNPDAYYDGGDEIVYDLDLYGLDMAVYNDQILLPYYLVNQLFAGSSYYNVYYNYDGLFGIYSLPDAGTLEYRAIKTSSMNGDDIPADLLIHTFSTLAFDLDYFYGLKEIMGVNTYYDLMYEQRKALLNSDPEAFDNAIASLLLKSIDEPHTSYGYPSYFNKTSWSGPVTNSLSAYGTRFQTWYYDGFVDVDDAIEAKWGRGDIASNAWAATSPNRPYYWFLSDTAGVLILDGFKTADIEESATYDASLVGLTLDVSDASLILPSLTGGSKYFYYNSSDDTHNVLEMLVEGTPDVSGFVSSLLAAGYTFNQEDTLEDLKDGGYYSKTIDGVDYMVVVREVAEYGLTYIGVANHVPTTYAAAWTVNLDFNTFIKSDSAVYMEVMLAKMTELKPLLNNVILDLTWNTGGNVGALYRVLGFITQAPFRTSHLDGDTNGESSNYVYITDVPDYSYLNWSLLISPLTFSAANAMATIFMENDLGAIIGVQSGGGACSITPILLPNGTAFTMSSNNINAYRTGTGTEEDPYVFHNNEFGIAPDYELAITSIYDNASLIAILNQIGN